MPPRVTRQTNKASPKKVEIPPLVSVPVKDIDRSFLDMLIIGDPGSGKTRFACSGKGKKLIVGPDDGTGTVADYEDTEYARISSSAQIDLIPDLVAEKKPDWLIFDHVSEYDTMVFGEVVGRRRDEDVIGFTEVNFDHYTEIKKRLLHLKTTFLSLRGQTNLIMLGNERVFNDDEKSMKQGKRMHTSVAMSEKTASQYHQAFDFVCQTYTSPKVEEVKIGTTSMTKKQVVPGNDHFLRVQPFEGIRTKIRTNKDLSATSSIKDPTLGKFQEYLKGKVFEC